MLHSFNKCSFSDLSVNGVNAIGENSNLSSQIRTQFHCVSTGPLSVCMYTIPRDSQL